jgi:NADH:ubiquinone oxidoreductase subunit 5 (subunit L)/multisubunit Na+/H+ antiporter MnhA subunit
MEIVFIPLLSSFICGLFGKSIGCRGVRLVSTVLLTITCFLSICSFYIVGLLKNPYYVILGTWVSSGNFNVD